MSESAGIPDVQRFRAAIARRVGLLFADSRLGFLYEVLLRRTESSRGSVSRYLDQLDSRESLPDEVRALAMELTVSETYFFRHLDQFRAFSAIAIPDRPPAHRTARRLSLLSAGCASGEEPYSLAILARDTLARDDSCKLSIRGVDLNAASLEKARLGRYSPWALRQTPEDIQHRWFRKVGSGFELDQEICGLVQFEERNLVQDNADLWQPGAYDIVFCRNMLMYLAPEHAVALLARITQALVPGGHLFLGHAETLRGLSNDYHLRHTHATFYYQRKDVLAQVREPTAPAPKATASAPASASIASVPPADAGWVSRWIETVNRASHRIAALAASPILSGSEGDTVRSDAKRPGPELALTLTLLERERYAEALEVLRGLPSVFAGNVDALLLRAVLLTHDGQLDAAEQVSKELLAIDGLNAGAHYLLALCREGTGDRQGAVDHDQFAAYLDPDFAMPRLHLGLLARRAGDRELASHALGQALALLQREEASRLLLFGGGFGREALMALCRAELVATGGKQ